MGMGVPRVILDCVPCRQEVSPARNKWSQESRHKKASLGAPVSWTGAILAPHILASTVKV